MNLEQTWGPLQSVLASDRMEEGGVYSDYEYVEYLDEDEEEFAREEFYVDQFYQQHDRNGELEMGGGGGLTPFTVSEILEHCIEPTLRDGVKHMGKIIAWCVFFRLATQSSSQAVPWLCHCASIVSGALLASHFFGSSVFILFLLMTLGYFVLVLSPRRTRGPASAALVVIFNLGLEGGVVEPVVWHQVRGAVMILAMKIISLGWDMDAAATLADVKLAEDKSEEVIDEAESEQKKELKMNTARHRGGKRSGKKSSEETENKEFVGEGGEENKEEPQELTEVPDWFEFAGYCLCPGTVVLGPWVSMAEYRQIFRQRRWNITWLIKIIFTSMFAFMFLTISTCWNPWLIPDSGWTWLLAYRDAMSFRASHYFVSFMSEASAIAAGFGCHVVGGQVLWHHTVTQPHNIEVPRSLVEVVISWNLPMHRWLKQYVFKQTRARLGPGLAVLATYLASTMLHGLSGQLAAVLLSLGLYTWVEHRLRDKLANIMGASIGARRETDNRRKHREGSAWVILVNLMFGLLTMFHLAYLGVMFDQSNPELQQTGYSWGHTLDKWKRLDFSSHWVVAGMLFINWLI